MGALRRIHRNRAGRRWNESKVKAITGGDKVSARFMRQDFFEYVPQFKLVIAGNHKPSIRNVDEAMKRRLHLIPFTVTVPPERRDGRLTERLLRTGRDPGVGGRGLQPVAAPGTAAARHRGVGHRGVFRGRGRAGQWIEERCLLAKSHREGVSELFADWREWAEARGRVRRFGQALSELMATRKFEKCRLTGGRTRHRRACPRRPKPGRLSLPR